MNGSVAKWLCQRDGESVVAQSNMAELDRVREKIAYLKYWQGFMVVTAISVFGWLLTAGILVLHRRIERFIDELGRL